MTSLKATTSDYDVQQFVNLMSDPIKLAIIFELLRKPDRTPHEIKKRLNITGSRIYYYLNQLVDKKVIEESDTEKITKTMSRSKFRITNWFSDVFKAVDKEFHNNPDANSKFFHLFQLHFARMMLEQQVRVLEQVPEKSFTDLMKSQNLPFQQIFFVNDDTSAYINEKHNEISTTLFREYKKYGDMIEIIKNTNRVAIFGTYDIDTINLV